MVLENLQSLLAKSWFTHKVVDWEIISSQKLCRSLIIFCRWIYRERDKKDMLQMLQRLESQDGINPDDLEDQDEDEVDLSERLRGLDLGTYNFWQNEHYVLISVRIHSMLHPSLDS